MKNNIRLLLLKVISINKRDRRRKVHGIYDDRKQDG